MSDGDGFEGFYTPIDVFERAIGPGTAGELWYIERTGTLPDDQDTISDEIRLARLEALDRYRERTHRHSAT